MAATRRHFLGIAAASLGLAGCLGGSGGGAGGSDSDATVRVRSNTDYGDILVGPDGRSLYLFEQDERGAGASSCTGGCAEAWPPLTVDGSASATDAVTGEVTTFERDDGSTQVAVNGWPLYYFQSDESPGDVTGQGVNDVWWVVATDGTAVTAKSTQTKTDAGPY